MKQMKIFYTLLMFAATIFFVACDDDPAAPVAEISAFTFASPVSATGLIDKTANTITINVPYGTDLTAVVGSVTATEGVTVSPDITAGVDFSSLTVTFTATNGGTSIEYVVSVIVGKNPLRLALIGEGANLEDNVAEVVAAYEWAIDTYTDPIAQYFSWDEIATLDLATTEAVWIHHSFFPASAGDLGMVEGDEDMSLIFSETAMSTATVDALKAYAADGGDFLLSAQAVPYIEVLGRIDPAYGNNLFWGPDKGGLPEGETWHANPDNWGISYQEGYFEEGQFPVDNADYYLFDGLTTSDVTFEGVTYPIIYMSSPGNKKDVNYVWLFPPYFNPDNPSYAGVTMAYDGAAAGDAIKAAFEEATSSTVRASFEWDPAAGGIELGTIVEFNGITDYPGTILTIGTATFEFHREGGDAGNTWDANVKGLAKNAIDKFLE